MQAVVRRVERHVYYPVTRLQPVLEDTHEVHRAGPMGEGIDIYHVLEFVAKFRQHLSTFR